MKLAGPQIASVTVELFGQARLVSGVRQIDMSLPSELGSSDLANALSVALPALSGVAVDEAGHELMPSYTANINGISFLADSTVRIADGDRIFIFSSQAGG